MAENKVIITSEYNPEPKQLYLHNSKARFRAGIGGVGGGKTRWLLEEALKLATDDFPGSQGIIIRRTFPEIKSALLPEWEEKVLPPKLIKEHNKTDYQYIVHTTNPALSSTITFISYDSVGKIRGTNLSWIAISQAEEFPEEYFVEFLGRLRGSKNSKIILEAQYAGHNWVWRRFIRDKDKVKDKNGVLLYDGIIMLTKDNTHLPDDYEQTLRDNVPAAWARYYLDCEEGGFEGLVYADFDDKKNLISKIPDDVSLSGEPESLLYPDGKFNIKDKDYIKLMFALDPGLDNPSAMLFAYFNMKTSQLVIFDEFYERDLSIDQQCHLFNVKCNKWGITKFWKSVGDPFDIDKRNVETKTKMLTLYRNGGINGLVPGSRDKDYGILETQNLLKPEKDDKGVEKPPKILVLNTLVNFQDERSQYAWSKGNKSLLEGFNTPGKAQDKKDHIMTCFRLLVSEVPLAWVSKNPEKYKNLHEKFIKKRFTPKRRLGMQIFLDKRNRSKFQVAQEKGAL